MTAFTPTAAAQALPPASGGPHFIYYAAHWHLLLNHLPVVAVPLGLALFAWGHFRPGQEMQKAGLGLWIFAGVTTIAAYLTGQTAGGELRRLGVRPALIHAHANAAGYALTGVLILAVAALLAWYGGHMRRLTAWPGWVQAGLLALGLIVCGLMFWTAETGGYIRHPEIRPGFRMPARALSVRPRHQAADEHARQKHQ